jgi:hypothetical protein
MIQGLVLKVDLLQTHVVEVGIMDADAGVMGMQMDDESVVEAGESTDCSHGCFCSGCWCKQLVWCPWCRKYYGGWYKDYLP